MREEKTQQILRDKQFHQKKSLGQHFLHDTNILREIVRLSGADRENAVLEIGPGAGTLTRMLSLKAGKVADVVIYDGHPLDTRSHVTTVIAGGEKVFER